MRIDKHFFFAVKQYDTVLELWPPIAYRREDGAVKLIRITMLLIIYVSQRLFRINMVLHRHVRIIVFPN